MKVSGSTLRLICVLVAFLLTYISLILWISLFFSLLSWSPIQFNIILLTDFHSSDKNKINRRLHVWVDHLILWITHFSFASLETNMSLWVFPTGTWVWNILLVRKLYLLRAYTYASLLSARTVVVQELKWLQSVKMFVPTFCSILAERQENQDLTECVLASSFTCCVHITAILAARFMKCCSACNDKTQ